MALQRSRLHQCAKYPTNPPGNYQKPLTSNSDQTAKNKLAVEITAGLIFTEMPDRNVTFKLQTTLQHLLTISSVLIKYLNNFCK